MSEFWNRFSRNKSAVLGLGILLVVIFLAGIASFIYPEDPFRLAGKPLSGPGLNGFLLGSDSLGRDVASGIAHGAKTSLLIGLIATLAAVFIGIIFGALSGYYGGFVDDLLMRITEIFQTIPSFVFAILLSQFSLLTFLWGASIGIWLSQELALKYQKQPIVIFLFPTTIILALYLYTSPGSTPIDFIFTQYEAVLLWAALALFLYKIEEIKLERTHAPYFWIGFASYTLATIIWQPSKTDGVLCDPQSLLQGHALWHLLGAISMWCFYIYFRTEVNNY